MIFLDIFVLTLFEFGSLSIQCNNMDGGKVGGDLNGKEMAMQRGG